jgi:nitroimidazol reductase NimA-like FMN-containing flavoprotein (pyridoxamine 5'-phosphate oxidase superfamily)
VVIGGTLDARVQAYHLRRTDKALEDPGELERIILGARTITVAMCRNNEPYLVVLNHGFDPSARCLYFHCAAAGKKVDFFTANPRVWGIAVEDLGYRDGACDHAFRSVMFAGTVELLTDDDDKRRALEIMIRQQESEPDRVASEQLTPARVASVTVGRIVVESMTGKQALPA